MNERELQAFLSGLPKHVPQRTAKVRAGQIISDSMHGLSGVGVVENGRVDIYAVALDGRDVQLNSIGAGECFGICNLLVGQSVGISAGRKAGRRRDFAARHAGRAGPPPVGQPCGAVSRTFGAAKRGLSGSRRKQASGSEHIGA